MVIIGVNLTLAWRLKPQLYKQNPPARVMRILMRALVRVGGLVFIDANSIRQRYKLTPMITMRPYQWRFKGKESVSPIAIT
jgi:hypothetical protein